MSPKIIIILIFISGLGLFSYSLLIPYYCDQSAADNLISSFQLLDKSDYYKREAEIRTNKTFYMDIGSGLVIAATTILIFLITSKIKKFSDFRNLTSIKKITIIITSNLVWFLLIPGTIWYYYFRFIRGDFPPFSESIGIPIFSDISFYLFSLIPLNLIIVLSTIKVKFPAKIFIIANRYEKWTIIAEIFFGSILTLDVVCFFSFLIDGDHFSIFVSLYFLYIVLVLRGGQIAKLQTPPPPVEVSHLA